MHFFTLQQAAGGGIPGMPPGMPPPGTPGLPPGLAGLPGMPPVSMAGGTMGTMGGLLSLAAASGHPGLPPTTSGSAMAAAAAAAAAGGAASMQNFHALMQQQSGLRPGAPLGLGAPPPSNASHLDEKPPMSMEDRLKHSSSASPHHAPPGPPSLPTR